MEGRKIPFSSRLLPLKLQIVCGGTYFADARERFTDPTRTLFGFSAGKRRVLLLGRREAVGEGGNEGLREVVREAGILLLPLKLLGF